MATFRNQTTSASEMYGPPGEEQAREEHHPDAPGPVVEREQQAQSRRGEQEQEPRPNPGPEQHGERDPDEHDRAAQIGLLEHQEKGDADDDARAHQVAQRAGRLPPAREIARQHQHGGHLGQLGRLADLVPADREPAAAALGGARAGADQQHQHQQEEAHAVEHRRQPLQQPGRDVEDDDRRDHADAHPDELAVPHTRRAGGHVGLARGVEGEQAEEDEPGAHQQELAVDASTPLTAAPVTPATSRPRSGRAWPAGWSPPAPAPRRSRD